MHKNHHLLTGTWFYQESFRNHPCVDIASKTFAAVLHRKFSSNHKADFLPFQCSTTQFEKNCLCRLHNLFYPLHQCITNMVRRQIYFSLILEYDKKCCGNKIFLENRSRRCETTSSFEPFFWMSLKIAVQFFLTALQL
jgi:hypothetical protein